MSTNKDEVSFAADTAKYLQEFATLSSKANAQQTQFNTNLQSTQKLQNSLNTNTQSIISSSSNSTNMNAQKPLIDEVKQIEDNLSTVNLNNNNQTSGIDDKTQGVMTVSRGGKQIKGNLYQSTRYKDFASMSKILRPELLDGCDKLNFTHPSKIQAEAIPWCLSQTADKSMKSYPNLIAQAHHGSGKTATFSLIMLQRIDENCHSVQGLVVVHSRELAIQTHNVISSLGQFISGLKIALALPGEPVPNPWDCQIIVGTPGTIIDRYLNAQKRSAIGIKGFLKDFKILVVDEADEFLKADTKKKLQRGRMQSSGFGNLFDQLKMITTDITSAVQTKFQTLLFSATYPVTVKKLAVEIAPDPFVIKVAQKSVQLDNIRVFKVMCDDEVDKFNTLLRVISLANIGQMIIFVNTVVKAKQLIDGLESKNLGIACSALYGRGMEIGMRDKTMEQFRKNQTQCLVASNVIARGIDVPAVGLVVNFEIPINQGQSEETGKTGFTFDSETFMHRVGRTGRFGAKGVCINLVSKEDSLGSDRLDAIQKEYSLDIALLDNSAKAVKESITNWLENTV